MAHVETCGIPSGSQWRRAIRIIGKVSTESRVKFPSLFHIKLVQVDRQQHLLRQLEVFLALNNDAQSHAEA